jgi:type II secretory pathway pseudopilin PulG
MKISAVAAMFAQPANRPTARPASRPTAFTLIELLVVIAIIMIVSSILVASFFGMIRGSSYAAVEKNVFNTLTLARQRACIDRSRVCLMFQNSNDFVVVRAAGRVTRVDYANGKVYDAYGDLSDDNAYTGTSGGPQGIKIYNMDTNGMATVDGIDLTSATATNYVTNTQYTRTELCFFISSPSPAHPFEPLDHYGLEVYQMQRIPKGFTCRVNTDSSSGLIPTSANMLKVIFEPDGRRGAGSITQIEVYETIVGNTPAHRVTFLIESDGKIKVKPIGT